MRRISVLVAAVLSVWAWSAQATEPALDYAPYVLAPSEGQANGLTGRLKANGRSTKGNYSVVVRQSQTAQAADAHTHSHLVEAWYVVEGAMTFRSKGKDIDAPAGTFVLVPPGVEHGFRIEPDRPVKLVQIFSPPGFENLFGERLKLPSYDPGRELSAQSAQWKADQKEIARKYGAGPVDQPSSGLPIVRSPEKKAGRRTLATAEDAAGRYTLEEVTLAPGSAPIPAATSPDKDNAWYVVSGELHYSVKTPEGWRKTVLRAGDFAFLPHGTAFDLTKSAEQAARFLRWQSTPRDAPTP